MDDIRKWAWRFGCVTFAATLEHILLEAARSDRKALSERERKHYIA